MLRFRAQIPVVLVLAFWLGVGTPAHGGAARDDRQRSEDAQSLFPGEQVHYVGIPPSRSQPSNRGAGQASLLNSQGMRELRERFQRSRTQTVYVAVGSSDDTLATDAIYFTLGRNNGQMLPGLHLIHVGGDWRRAEQLRARIEALGAKYYIVRRDPSASAGTGD